MLNKLPPLKESPSQTAGPYVHIGLTPSRRTYYRSQYSRPRIRPGAGLWPPHHCHRPYLRRIGGAGE